MEGREENDRPSKFNCDIKSGSLHCFHLLHVVGKSQERAIAMVSQNVGMISRVVGSVFGGFSITLPFPERAIAPFNAATLNPSRALRIAAAHTHTQERVSAPSSSSPSPSDVMERN